MICIQCIKIESLFLALWRSNVVEIKDRLKEARKKKEFSQAYVADQLNISRQSVSKWETGANTPDHANLVLLCQLFDVTSDYILYGKESIEESQQEAVYERNIELLQNGSEEHAENFMGLETSVQKALKIEKRSMKEEVMLGIILALINVIFWFLSPLGLIVAPITIVKSKTTTRFLRIIVIVVSIISILVSLFSIYTIMPWGVTTSVEYIGP